MKWFKEVKGNTKVLLGWLQTSAGVIYLTTSLSINGTTADIPMGYATLPYKGQHTRIWSAYQKKQFSLEKKIDEMVKQLHETKFRVGN